MIVLILSVITGALFNSEALMFSNILKAVTAYVVTIFPIMVLAVIIAFMANVFRSSALVFFLSIIFFAASMVLGLVFSSYSNLFVTSSIDWYRLWIADSLPIGSLILQFTYMAGYALVFFTAGFYVFDRRDL
jgi:ABC-2 type transport system permease protein